MREIIGYLLLLGLLAGCFQYMASATGYKVAFYIATLSCVLTGLTYVGFKLIGI